MTKPSKSKPDPEAEVKPEAPALDIERAVKARAPYRDPEGTRTILYEYQGFLYSPTGAPVRQGGHPPEQHVAAPPPPAKRPDEDDRPRGVARKNA
jgi:hypothetical protein